MKIASATVAIVPSIEHDGASFAAWHVTAFDPFH
jgi:hypothetical protein